MQKSVVPSGSPQRIIELKLPLPYLLSLLGAFALLIIGMYFRGEKTDEIVKELKLEVRELKAEVKSGNSLQATMNSTVQLLQFRLETAESDIRTLKNTKK